MHVHGFERVLVGNCHSIHVVVIVTIVVACCVLVFIDDFSFSFAIPAPFLSKKLFTLFCVVRAT